MKDTLSGDWSLLGWLGRLDGGLESRLRGVVEYRGGVWCGGVVEGREFDGNNWCSR